MTAWLRPRIVNPAMGLSSHVFAPGPKTCATLDGATNRPHTAQLPNIALRIPVDNCVDKLCSYPQSYTNFT